MIKNKIGHKREETLWLRWDLQRAEEKVFTSVSFNNLWSCVWPWVLAISVGVWPCRLAVCSARSAPGHCRSRLDTLLNPYWAAKWRRDGTAAWWISDVDIRLDRNCQCKHSPVRPEKQMRNYSLCVIFLDSKDCTTYVTAFSGDNMKVTQCSV